MLPVFEVKEGRRSKLHTFYGYNHRISLFLCLMALVHLTNHRPVPHLDRFQRWFLLFIHDTPVPSGRGRIKTWRRIKTGACVGGTYVLKLQSAVLLVRLKPRWHREKHHVGSQACVLKLTQLMTATHTRASSRRIDLP